MKFILLLLISLNTYAEIEVSRFDLAGNEQSRETVKDQDAADKLIHRKGSNRSANP